MTWHVCMSCCKIWKINSAQTHRQRRMMISTCTEEIQRAKWDIVYVRQHPLTSLPFFLTMTKTRHPIFPWWMTKLKISRQSSESQHTLLAFSLLLPAQGANRITCRTDYLIDDQDTSADLGLIFAILDENFDAFLEVYGLCHCKNTAISLRQRWQEETIAIPGMWCPSSLSFFYAWNFLRSRFLFGPSSEVIVIVIILIMGMGLTLLPPATYKANKSQWLSLQHQSGFRLLLVP